MDYSRMTDFEINLAVFEALHDGSPDCKEGSGGSMVIVSFEGDVVDGNAVEIEVERGVFNPCNNPVDAWPIIVSNRIGLNFVNGAWRAQSMVRGYDECVHENPLRAVAIVYLMMQEAK